MNQPQRIWWAMLALLLLCCGPAARATHIVGGEMQLQLLPGGRYDLNLNLYFDRVNGAPTLLNEDSIRIGLFSKSSRQRLVQYLGRLQSRQSLIYEENACSPSPIGTILIRYKVPFIDLSSFDDTAGYYFAWDRCCRNGTISNLDNPGGTGSLFYLEWNNPATLPLTAPINSTPVFDPPFVPTACIGYPFSLFFGARDNEGDSLAYRLITPLGGFSRSTSPAPNPIAGPYPTVDWAPGYNANRAIPGNPALRINAKTGELTMVPSTVGLYVFAIEVREFRKGVLLSVTNRDFQLPVIRCPAIRSANVRVQTRPGAALVEQSPGMRDVLNVDTLTVPRCVNIVIRDTVEPLATTTFRLVTFGRPFTISQRKQTYPVGGGKSLDSTVISICNPTCGTDTATVYNADLIVTKTQCGIVLADTVRLAFRFKVEFVTPPKIEVLVSNRTLQANVNEPLVFTVRATAVDSSLIELSALPAGFTLGSANMVFRGAQGRGKVEADFTWLVDCSLQSRIRNRKYKVTFVAFKPLSCGPNRQDTLSVTLGVEQPPTLTVDRTPGNIVTPNCDGYNDAFTLPIMPDIPCQPPVFSQVRIYNRWGRLVYRDDSKNFRWEANDVSPGTYYFLVDYTNGESYQGWVEVVK